MPQPLQTHLHYLPVALQQAILKFAGLPACHRTADRLASLVDGHLEAYGMAGDGRRSHFLSSALVIAKQRFGIAAERRGDTRRAA